MLSGRERHFCPAHLPVLIWSVPAHGWRAPSLRRDFIDSFQVPRALVLGNHDLEGGVLRHSRAFGAPAVADPPQCAPLLPALPPNPLPPSPNHNPACAPLDPPCTPHGPPCLQGKSLPPTLTTWRHGLTCGSSPTTGGGLGLLLLRGGAACIAACLRQQGSTCAVHLGVRSESDTVVLKQIHRYRHAHAQMHAHMHTCAHTHTRTHTNTCACAQGG